MKNRIQVKVNLDIGTAEMLDAIAAAIGSDELTPKPSRSDLLNKAALLYIDRARRRARIHKAIEEVESRLAHPKNSRLKVISSARHKEKSHGLMGQR